MILKRLGRVEQFDQIRLCTYRGFSLLQVLISVFIVLIVVQASVASFNSLLVNKGIQVAGQELESRLYNAMNRGKHSLAAIAVCGGLELTCSSNNWSDGYITMTSIKANGPNSELQALFRSEPLKRKVKIKKDVDKLVVLPGGFFELVSPVIFIICSEGLPSDAIRLRLEPNGLITQTLVSGPTKCDEITA